MISNTLNSYLLLLEGIFYQQSLQIDFIGSSFQEINSPLESYCFEMLFIYLYVISFYFFYSISLFFSVTNPGMLYCIPETGSAITPSGTAIWPPKMLDSI